MIAGCSTFKLPASSSFVRQKEKKKKNKETRAARNVYAHNKHRERGDWKLPEASVNSRWLDTPESLSDRQRMLKKKKKNKTPFFKNTLFEKYCQLTAAHYQMLWIEREHAL